VRSRVTIEPAEDPVTLSEAKVHLRVDTAAEDTFISSLIAAAADVVENERRGSLVTRTIEATYDAREMRPPIDLPYGPVVAVEKIETWTGGAWVEVNASAYQVAGDRIVMSQEPGAEPWPTADRVFDAMRVTYTAGFGAAADVPAALKQATLLTVGDLYENRETLVGAGLVVTSVPVSARVLIAPYINYSL
jgi:uncharacterized phiE125 gp8 family phage protein